MYTAKPWAIREIIHYHSMDNFHWVLNGYIYAEYKSSFAVDIRTWVSRDKSQSKPTLKLEVLFVL